MGTFDQKSVIEAILYILSKADRPVTKYQIVKILYFADLLHLRRYGRTISGDWYAAMKFGPVPSQSYRIIQPLFNQDEPDYADIANVLTRGNGDYDVLPKRPPDRRMFSKSELECLDEVIADVLPRTFTSVKDKSHGPSWAKAWELAQLNNKGRWPIKIEWIIEEIGVEEGEDWVEAITEHINEYGI